MDNAKFRIHNLSRRLCMVSAKISINNGSYMVCRVNVKNNIKDISLTKYIDVHDMNISMISMNLSE